MRLFKRIFHKKTSGNLAKDRLKVLLVSDRVGCAPDTLDMMKEEVIHVISKYMDINAEDVEMQITHTKTSSTGEESTVLFANVPIREMKHAV